jgi:hypothetical protein
VDRVLDWDRSGLDIGCSCAAQSRYGEWLVRLATVVGSLVGPEAWKPVRYLSTRDVSLHRHGRRAQGAYGETLTDAKRGLSAADSVHPVAEQAGEDALSQVLRAHGGRGEASAGGGGASAGGES